MWGHFGFVVYPGLRAPTFLHRLGAAEFASVVIEFPGRFVLIPCRWILNSGGGGGGQVTMALFRGFGRWLSLPSFAVGSWRVVGVWHKSGDPGLGCGLILDRGGRAWGLGGPVLGQMLCLLYRALGGGIFVWPYLGFRGGAWRGIGFVLFCGLGCEWRRGGWNGCERIALSCFLIVLGGGLGLGGGGLGGAWLLG